MVKSVAAGLLSDIALNVTTLSICVEITRKDGRILRITTHDSDLTIDGNVYRHDIPFVLGAIQSGTQMQVDNTGLTLFCDGTNVLLSDFKASLYEYASVTIFQVNYTDPTRGKITMRTGWFGPIDWSENGVVVVTLTGLLKILDLEIGHLYQASCDADFGDSRCKIAVKFEQIWSELNPMHLGEWVFYYDPALMNLLTVVNPSFESDGSIGSGTPITGWTKSTGSQFQVRADGGVFGSFGPLDSGHMLTGATVPSTPFESSLSQVINVSAQIADNAAIDDGEIMIYYSAALLVSENLHNVSKIRIELLDTNGVILDSQDSRYVRADVIDVWREKACVLPLLPGTRSVRIWIYFITGPSGLHGGNAADRIRLYWWDHTLGNPYSDVIYHAVRMVDFGGNARYALYNPSFELPGGGVANANNPTLPTWVTGAGNWWQIVPNAFPAGPSHTLTAADGTQFLRGGDDGGTTRREYVTSQVHPLTTALSLQGWALDSARILLEKYTGVFYISAATGPFVAGTKATGSYAFSGVATAGDRVTIQDDSGHTVVFNFVASGAVLGSTNVNIGASATASAANLAAEINQQFTMAALQATAVAVTGTCTVTEEDYKGGTLSENIDTGSVITTTNFSGGVYPKQSTGSVIVEWLTDALAVVGTDTVANDVIFGTGWHTLSKKFKIPPTATKVKVTLKAHSPKGYGDAQVAFDLPYFVIYDGELPSLSDPSSGMGSAATVFDPTIGAYTFDGGVAYKALSALTQFDVVASVSDPHKTFIGTSITGEVGDFETAGIRFISGANAGLRNIIRRWDSGLQELKLYFRTPYPIGAGDRFVYSVSCQRRFIADCVLRFENGLNFRGFPYVPGAIQNPNTSGQLVTQVGGSNTTSGLSITPATGLAAGGYAVDILATGGTPFSGSPTTLYTFKFGTATVAGWAIQNNNQATLIAPAHAAGVVDITYYFNGTLQGTLGSFTYT